MGIKVKSSHITVKESYPFLVTNEATKGVILATSRGVGVVMDPGSTNATVGSECIFPHETFKKYEGVLTLSNN